MLILLRGKHQQIVIGDDIVIEVAGIYNSDTVRLRIFAPPGTTIDGTRVESLQDEIDLTLPRPAVPSLGDWIKREKK